MSYLRGESVSEETKKVIPLESDLLDSRDFLVRPLPQPTPAAPGLPALAHAPRLPRLLLLPVAFQVPIGPDQGSRRPAIAEFLMEVAEFHDEESPGVTGE